MPIERQPSPAESDALAERVRALRRHGEVLRPWLRKHDSLLCDPVDDDWSCAGAADARARARITYQTRRPWSAEGLRREAVRAIVPLRRKMAGRPAFPPAHAAEPAEPDPPAAAQGGRRLPRNALSR
jgi:hypothetical protein